MQVKIGDIDIAAYQIRDGLNEDTVAQYAEVLEANPGHWPFPAVVLTREGLRCVDGAHRIAAAMRVGREEVEAEYSAAENEDDARIEAAVANLRNGLPLTAAERRKAIRRVMEARPAWTDAQVADRMGLHRNTVARVRKELGLGNRTERTAKAVADNPTLSQAEMAKKLGVSQQALAALPKRKNTTNAQHGAFVVTHEGIQPLPLRPHPEATDAENTPVPGPQEPEGDEGEALLAQYRDEIGQDIPAGRKAEYDEERAAVEGWLTILRRLKSGIKAAAEEPRLRAFHAPARRMDDVLHDIDILAASIKERRPECLCKCNGEGCRVCDGRGFLTRKQYELLIPEDERFA